MNDSFLPSDVRPLFPCSVFHDTEKEIMAAQIVTFLAKNGDVWNTVITFELFFEHTESEDSVAALYQKPLSNSEIAEQCNNALYYFVDEGFSEWVEERRSFKVTEKFIDFYSRYVRS